MIKHFSCRETEKIWQGMTSSTLPLNIQATARRKLRIPNNASSLHDMSVSPANHLEYLKSHQKSEYSICIKGSWRLSFTWENNAAHNVKIIDEQQRRYHGFTQYSSR